MNRHRKIFVVLLLVAGPSLAVPSLVGTYWVIVALNLAMWIALTQSWALFSGMTGYVSLGHVVFYGIGAYFTASTFQVLPIWASIPLAGVIAGVFACAIAIPVLRVRGPYFVILTFGVAELVKFLALNLETEMGKSSRLLFGAPGVEQLYYAMVVLAASATLLTYLVMASRFGRGLIAIREDETAAETVGVPTVRFKIVAFTLAAIVPGMVGGLVALRSTYFEVLQVFSPVVSFTIVSMGVIGGSGDVRGPLLGAVFLVALSEMLWSNAPQLYMILLGVFLIAFVLFAPNGLVGLLGKRPGGGT